MPPMRHGRPHQRGLWSNAAFRGPADSGSGSTASSPPPPTDRDKAVKFAECMRENGVSAFPDPDASGELTLDGVVNGSSLDPDRAAFKQAIRACKDLQPPGFTGSKANARSSECAPRSSPSASARTA